VLQLTSAAACIPVGGLRRKRRFFALFNHVRINALPKLFRFFLALLRTVTHVGPIVAHTYTYILSSRIPRHIGCSNAAAYTNHAFCSYGHTDLQ